METTDTIPEQYTATVPITAEVRQMMSVGDSLALAESFVVNDAVTADLANRELRAVKERAKKLDDTRKSLVDPLRKVIDNIQALFKPAIESLAQAETIYKRKLADYTEAERQKAEEARRAQEEAERKARQKAEQEAAAARAKAEQEAAEARRRAQEAEEARRKDEAEGNARAAAAAAAEAARLQERAAAVIENGEAKAMAAQAIQVAAAPQVAAPAAIKGFTTRDNWVAELATTEENAKLAIVKAIADGRADLLPLLAIDMKAANALAKALKSAMAVPGLKAVNKPIAASRR